MVRTPTIDCVTLSGHSEKTEQYPFGNMAEDGVMYAML